MDQVTLKRGRGTINLVKSEDLIAVRPTAQTSVGEVLALSPTEMQPVDTGTTLGGFRIVKVTGEKAAMEETLDSFRRHFTVDAGSHVYHTPENTAPIVPTGKITLRFKPEASGEQRQAILDEHKLEILDSSVKENADGSKTETYTVSTTPDSPNPLKVAETLQESTVVSLAEPDLATPGRLFAFQLPSDEFFREQWHLKNEGVQFGTPLGLKAGADARVVAAWQRLQSFGSPACVVAVIDDGFDLSHPDLSGTGKVVAPWDFTTNSSDPAPRNFNPDSRFGDYHGTACAGVAIGNASGGGIVGAAPNCRFMPIRWSSMISDDSIKRWFGYVARQGAWVVSCSWGVSSASYTLSTVMDEAITECATEGRGGLGCVVVFAAGNSNHDINDPQGGTSDPFATHPDVIAVAACTSRDEKSSYSNFGKEISVCAPSSGTGGRGILTSDVRGTFQFGGATVEAGYDAGDYTKTFGGTSSATPLVAGICALLLSANPSLTAKQVKTILERTARRIGNDNAYTDGHSIYFGRGCVNADDAVALAHSLANPATDLTGAPQENDGGESDESDGNAAPGLFADEFWGHSRHELIAHVADRKLSPQARARVAQILAPLGNNLGLKDVATWADEIKGRTAAQGGDPDTVQFLTDFPDDASRDWHYINLPLGISSYEQARQMEFTRDDDIVTMIARTVRILAGTPGEMSQVNALRWLVHMVGDVHQPLHVGCGFIDETTNPPRIERDPQIVRQNRLESDKGGNDLLLPLGGNSGTPLHGYWDSQIPGDISVNPLGFSANGAASSEKQYVQSKEQAIAKLSEMVERRSAAALTTKTAGVARAPANQPTPERWAEKWAMKSLEGSREAYETLEITRRQGRKYKVSWEGKPDYDRRCREIVTERLTSAAQHLADLINAIL